MSGPSLANSVEIINTEAAGVLQLHVIRPDDELHLLAAALAGDRQAERLMRAVVDSVTRVECAPRRSPILCVCRPRRLRGTAFAVGVALPDRHNPTRALGFGICERCAGDGKSLPAKATEALRSIWPGLRIVRTTDHAPGHA